MTTDPVVIASYARTPMGGFQGDIAGTSSVELGAFAVKAALERAGVDGDQVEQIFMGCVLPAGLGQAPARQAALGAGLPKSVEATTVNKMCGSGMQAAIMAHDALIAGSADIIVAGGMESMSNAPYYLPQARTGYRMGHGQLVDGMIFDGLWDPYKDYHMGIAGELCASERKIDRERQDAFATASYQRAQNAVREGLFKDEIIAVEIAGKKGETTVIADDEEPFRGAIDKLAGLRPAFKKDGTITAGNASTINDGAAALVVMSADEAKRRGLTPLARIAGYAGAAGAPEWFTTAPAKAIQNLLTNTGHKVADVDLWEINEAFSIVALVNQDELGIPAERLNVRGGAVALGHPIGASGARILTTLLYALRQLGKQRGVASLCIGGGEAVALMVEVL